MSMQTLEESIRRIVKSNPVVYAQQSMDTIKRYLLDSNPMNLWKDNGPIHATASCYAFDIKYEKILLVFHKKGHFWVQPGGHLERVDATIEDAVLRELREETGLSAVTDAVFNYDIDVHTLSSGFGRCTAHIDFGVSIVMDDKKPLTLSDESQQLGWFKIDSLPSPLASNVTRRIAALMPA